jgi:hypothetical protein
MAASKLLIARAESHPERRFVGTVLAHRVDCSPMRDTS